MIAFTRRLIILMMVLAIYMPSIVAGNTDGLALMKTEHGARIAGMGGTFTYDISDPNAVVFNPATAVGTKNFTASFGHTAYWENIRLESGFFATNLSSKTSLHGGVRFAVVDKIEARTTPTDDPDFLFDAHEVSFKAGLSYQLNEKLSLGFAAGWFIQEIGRFRGTAFNVDLGVVMQVNDQLNLSGSVLNLGQSYQLDSVDISLPTTFRVGGAYTYDKYTGAIEAVVVDDDFHLHSGVQADLHELFSLRSGYMFGYDSKSFTAGASFKKRNITVDYGFVPFGNNLGTSHLFNLTFSL